MSNYPGSLDSFSTKRFKQDVNRSADINALQDAIVAIETELGTDPAGSLTNVKTFLQRCLATNGAMRQGTSFPGSPNEGDFFYRTDQDKMYIYDGSAWDAVSLTPDYAAGTILLASSDGVLTVSDASYTKRKSIKVPRSGTLTIKFTLTGSGGGNSTFGRIYRNGVAVGTERECTTSSQTEYSEDISGWNAQDEVQIYCRRDSVDGSLRNFRIYADQVTTETEVYNS